MNPAIWRVYGTTYRKVSAKKSRISGCIVTHCLKANDFFILVFLVFRFDEKTRKELAVDKQDTIRQEQGQKMAAMVGAKRYLECSARTKEGVREVFEAAAELATEKKHKTPNPFCRCL